MKRTLALLLMLALMTAVLFGCASPQTTAPTTTKSTKVDTITVVVPRSMECLDDISMWCADYFGYFADQNLRFVMQQAYGTSDIKMVATGQADLAIPSPNLLLSSIQEGLPVISVSHYDAINIFGFAVKKDSPIKTWADMKGKTCALGDAAWASIAAPTLLAGGLDPNKDLTYVVSGDARYQVVNEGKADILFTWVSEYEQLLGQGFDFRYIDGNEVLPVFANPFVSSTKLVAENPDLIKRFLKAQNKGMYALLKNPEVGADIVLNRFPAIQVSWKATLAAANGRNRQAFGLTPATTTQILDKDGIGFGNDAAWTKVMEGAIASGVIKAAIDLKKCYTNALLPGVLSEADRKDVEADLAAYKFTSAVYKKEHP